MIWVYGFLTVIALIVLGNLRMGGAELVFYFAGIAGVSLLPVAFLMANKKDDHFRLAMKDDLFLHLFVVVLTASVIAHPRALSFAAAIFGLCLYVLFFIIHYLVFVREQGNKTVSAIHGGLGALAILTAIIVLLKRFTPSGISGAAPFKNTYLFSTQNLNHLDDFCLICLIPFLITFLFSAKTALRKTGMALALLICVLALAATSSRTGIAAFGALLVYLGCIYKPGRRWVLIFGFAFAAVWIFDPNWHRKLFQVVESQTYNPLLSRLDMWKFALRLGLDHPIFGVGIGAFSLQYPLYHPTAVTFGPLWPHNLYLHLFCEVGFLVAVMAVVFLLRFFIGSTKKLMTRLNVPDQRAWFHLSALGCLVSLMIFTLLDF